MSDSAPTARIIAPAGTRAALIAIAIGLVLLGLLFHAECTAAVGVWIESTAYNHGFLIIPIALWLAWDRRARLVACPIRPTPLIALAALPLAMAWLLAERLGIMEGRQLAVIGFVEVLFAAVLGWRMSKAAAGPLLYLIFLVPFGAFLTGSLQDFTVSFVVHGLDLLGIANYSNGYIIQIPEGVFFVAQACAGLRFLIAAVAFGALYALMMYRSPWRRLAFMVASVIVPIVANGFRALGIVVLGHVLGSAKAAATDHILYGWLFFSIVILLLVLVGLPFRQDGTDIIPATTPRAAAPVARDIAAIILLLVVAGIGPAIATTLDRGAVVARLAMLPALPGPNFCTASPIDQQAHPGRLTLRRDYACAGSGFTLRVDVFGARSGPGRVLTRQRNAIQHPGAEDIEMHWLPDPTPGSHIWQMVSTTQPTSASVSGLWIGGVAANGGLGTRIRQARASLLGGDKRPIVATLTVTRDANPADGGAAVLVGFIAQSPELAHSVASLANASLANAPSADAPSSHAPSTHAP